MSMSDLRQNGSELKRVTHILEIAGYVTLPLCPEGRDASRVSEIRSNMCRTTVLMLIDIYEPINACIGAIC